MAKGEKVTKSSLPPKKVFVNCPFDKEYLPLLRPLVFAIIRLGCEPLLSSHRNDSADNRLQKILGLIEKADISIHDLSRCVSTKANQHFRLNMPFEFGIDFAHRHFVSLEKRMLVLEDKPYNATKAISDFAGCDLMHHKNKPEKVVYAVRNWLLPLLALDDDYPLGSQVWDDYNEFYWDLFEKEKYKEKDVEGMPIAELIRKARKWVDDRKDRE